MSKEYSFNLETTSTNKPIALEKQLYAAFVVKGDPEEITKLKDHILQTNLHLIYHHRDSRYLKVSTADPKDNF
jgi:hypothetical protein